MCQLLFVTLNAQLGQARRVLTQINAGFYDKKNYVFFSTTQLLNNHKNRRKSASKDFVVNIISFGRETGFA